MIGADAAQRSIIQQAELTPDFRIVVYGQNGRQLDPSQDLNGASAPGVDRRIYSRFDKVSEVEAPNVIRYPAGMMSGYVKTFRAAESCGGKLPADFVPDSRGNPWL